MRVVAHRIEALRLALREVVLVGAQSRARSPPPRRRSGRRGCRCAPACGPCGRRPASACRADRRCATRAIGIVRRLDQRGCSSDARRDDSGCRAITASSVGHHARASRASAGRPSASSPTASCSSARRRRASARRGRRETARRPAAIAVRVRAVERGAIAVAVGAIARRQRLDQRALARRDARPRTSRAAGLPRRPARRSPPSSARSDSDRARSPGPTRPSRATGSSRAASRNARSASGWLNA